MHPTRTRTLKRRSGRNPSIHSPLPSSVASRLRVKSVHDMHKTRLAGSRRFAQPARTNRAPRTTPALAEFSHFTPANPSARCVASIDGSSLANHRSMSSASKTLPSEPPCPLDWRRRSRRLVRTFEDVARRHIASQPAANPRPVDRGLTRATAAMRAATGG